MASEPSGHLPRPGTPHPEYDSEDINDPSHTSDALDTADPLTVNLHVTGPALGSGGGSIIFTALPAAINIRQLKEQIRERLAGRPAPESQRLIYRGRPLMRDSETLLQIFGSETVGSKICYLSTTFCLFFPGPSVMFG